MPKLAITFNIICNVCGKCLDSYVTAVTANTVCLRPCPICIERAHQKGIQIGKEEK